MLQKKMYAQMSDKELIDGLIAVPANSRLHKFFFQEKCKLFLKYISATLYDEEDGNTLVGELYEFLSNDNWKILRKWEGKNGCSLNSYLASCSMHYFAGRVRAEKKRNVFEAIPSSPDIIEYLDHFTAEEENEMPPVWEAYGMLKERDQVILRLLVIEELDMLAAAREIWPYINSSHAIHEVTQKHLQSTIAMAKHRALLALLNNLKRLTRN